MAKIAIIGLGLIGGSMGLALKRAKLTNTEVVGFDRDPQVAARALKAGAIQSAAATLQQAVSTATIIIVATPILSVRKVFEEIAPHLQRNALVTDTASTKQEVMRWAQEILPEGVHFVGGHPMAGKEKSGPQAAEESLFDGRPYVLIPSVSAGGGAVQTIQTLAQTIGAEPTFLDAAEHDTYAAAISHLPLVASMALFSLARGSLAWPELGNMAGPAFRDFTRLASGEPEMSHDIFLTNRVEVLHWLERYVAELQRLAELIGSDNSEALFRAIAEAQMDREAFLSSPPVRETPGPGVELPGQLDSFMSQMAGVLWQQRASEITHDLEERSRERQREERLRRRED